MRAKIIAMSSDDADDSYKLTRDGINSVDEDCYVGVADMFILVEVSSGAGHHLTPVRELVVSAELFIQLL